MPYYEPITPEAPIRERLNYYQGTNFKFRAEAQDDAGDPYDFTGYTFRMLIKSLAGDDDGDAVVTISNSDFTISATSAGTTAGVNDVYTINSAPANFTALADEPRKYFYVIELTDGSGDVFNHYIGDFIVKRD